MPKTMAATLALSLKALEGCSGLVDEFLDGCVFDSLVSGGDVGPIVALWRGAQAELRLRQPDLRPLNRTDLAVYQHLAVLSRAASGPVDAATLASCLALAFAFSFLS